MAYTILKHCMYCESCQKICPNGAIQLKGYVLEVESGKCVDCGKCAEICHIGAIKPAGIVKSVSKHEKTELDCDICIIGAGGAGLVAAAKAATESGKKVIVLERANKPGGCAWYALGIFMLSGSKYESSQGIKNTIPEKIRQAAADTMWKLDQKLINSFFVSYGEFVDFLHNIDPMDVETHFAAGIHPWTKEMAIDYKIIDGEVVGAYIMRKMLEQCKKYGVTILTQHSAKEIILDKDGKVCGVLAEDQGGDVQINCKACVMAAGNWENNDKLLEEFNINLAHNRKEQASPHLMPTNTGDAVFIAEKAGALVDHKEFCIRMFGPMPIPFHQTIGYFALQKEVIYVSKTGKRWINEVKGMYDGALALLQQPNCCTYVIFSEEIMNLAADRVLKDNTEYDRKHSMLSPNYKEIIQSYLTDEIPHKKADTIEELAELTGIDKNELIKTMNKYNKYCDEGIDSEFYKPLEALYPMKQGPYYAVYSKITTDGAFGGPLVNADMEVVKQDKIGVIPGFFAAGDGTNGRCISIYGQKKDICSDLGWALGSGYIAGKSVVKYLD